ncbi:hypothetical protein OPT61_g8775 [Boeremia exigua]|uniref:Uncharacterized protein n=1 Tax=Boeremia exigua TaxID=749465 RepID=A0ACC2HXB6_9PLEO|nr:hypothetical protein OPT61_g8775 [Boeremia exigua]
MLTAHRAPVLRPFAGRTLAVRLLGSTFQNATQHGLDGLGSTAMATNGIRDIGRGEWEGRQQDETQCDADDLDCTGLADAEFALQPPTPRDIGPRNRDVKSTNSSRASDHLVSLEISCTNLVQKNFGFDIPVVGP